MKTHKDANRGIPDIVKPFVPFYDIIMLDTVFSLRYVLYIYI